MPPEYTTPVKLAGDGQENGGLVKKARNQQEFCQTIFKTFAVLPDPGLNGTAYKVDPNRLQNVLDVCIGNDQIFAVLGALKVVKEAKKQETVVGDEVLAASVTLVNYKNAGFAAAAEQARAALAANNRANFIAALRAAAAVSGADHADLTAQLNAAADFVALPINDAADLTVEPTLDNAAFVARLAAALTAALTAAADNDSAVFMARANAMTSFLRYTIEQKKRELEEIEKRITAGQQDLHGKLTYSTLRTAGQLKRPLPEFLADNLLSAEDKNLSAAALELSIKCNKITKTSKWTAIGVSVGLDLLILITLAVITIGFVVTAGLLDPFMWILIVGAIVFVAAPVIATAVYHIIKPILRHELANAYSGKSDGKIAEACRDFSQKLAVLAAIPVPGDNLVEPAPPAPVAPNTISDEANKLRFVDGQVLRPELQLVTILQVNINRIAVVRVAQQVVEQVVQKTAKSLNPQYNVRNIAQIASINDVVQQNFAKELMGKMFVAGNFAMPAPAAVPAPGAAAAPVAAAPAAAPDAAAAAPVVEVVVDPGHVGHAPAVAPAAVAPAAAAVAAAPAVARPPALWSVANAHVNAAGNQEVFAEVLAHGAEKTWNEFLAVVKNPVVSTPPVGGVAAHDPGQARVITRMMALMWNHKWHLEVTAYNKAHPTGADAAARAAQTQRNSWASDMFGDKNAPGRLFLADTNGLDLLNGDSIALHGTLVELQRFITAANDPHHDTFPADFLRDVVLHLLASASQINGQNDRKKAIANIVRQCVDVAGDLPRLSDAVHAALINDDVRATFNFAHGVGDDLRNQYLAARIIAEATEELTAAEGRTRDATAAISVSNGRVRDELPALAGTEEAVQVYRGTRTETVTANGVPDANGRAPDGRIHIRNSADEKFQGGGIFHQNNLNLITNPALRAQTERFVSALREALRGEREQEDLLNQALAREERRINFVEALMVGLNGNPALVTRAEAIRAASEVRRVGAPDPSVAVDQRVDTLRGKALTDVQRLVPPGVPVDPAYLEDARVKLLAARQLIMRHRGTLAEPGATTQAQEQLMQIVHGLPAVDPLDVEWRNRQLTAKLEPARNALVNERDAENDLIAESRRAVQRIGDKIVEMSGNAVAAITQATIVLGQAVPALPADNDDVAAWRGYGDLAGRLTTAMRHIGGYNEINDVVRPVPAPAVADPVVPAPVVLPPPPPFMTVMANAFALAERAEVPQLLPPAAPVVPPAAAAPGAAPGYDNGVAICQQLNLEADALGNETGEQRALKTRAMFVAEALRIKLTGGGGLTGLTNAAIVEANARVHALADVALLVGWNRDAAQQALDDARAAEAARFATYNAINTAVTVDAAGVDGQSLTQVFQGIENLHAPRKDAPLAAAMPAAPVPVAPAIEQVQTALEQANAAHVLAERVFSAEDLRIESLVRQREIGVAANEVSGLNAFPENFAVMERTLQALQAARRLLAAHRVARGEAQEHLNAIERAAVPVSAAVQAAIAVTREVLEVEVGADQRLTEALKVTVAGILRQRLTALIEASAQRVGEIEGAEGASAERVRVYAATTENAELKAAQAAAIVRVEACVAARAEVEAIIAELQEIDELPAAAAAAPVVAAAAAAAAAPVVAVAAMAPAAMPEIIAQLDREMLAEQQLTQKLAQEQERIEANSAAALEGLAQAQAAAVGQIEASHQAQLVEIEDMNKPALPPRGGVAAPAPVAAAAAAAAAAGGYEVYQEFEVVDQEVSELRNPVLQALGQAIEKAAKLVLPLSDATRSRAPTLMATPPGSPTLAAAPQPIEESRPRAITLTNSPELPVDAADDTALVAAPARAPDAVPAPATAPDAAPALVVGDDLHSGTDSPPLPPTPVDELPPPTPEAKLDAARKVYRDLEAAIKEEIAVKKLKACAQKAQAEITASQARLLQLNHTPPPGVEALVELATELTQARKSAQARKAFEQQQITLLGDGEIQAAVRTAIDSIENSLDRLLGQEDEALGNLLQDLAQDLCEKNKLLQAAICEAGRVSETLAVDAKYDTKEIRSQCLPHLQEALVRLKSLKQCYADVQQAQQTLARCLGDKINPPAQIAPPPSPLVSPSPEEQALQSSRDALGAAQPLITEGYAKDQKLVPIMCGLLWGIGDKEGTSSEARFKQIPMHPHDTLDPAITRKPDQDFAAEIVRRVQSHFGLAQERGEGEKQVVLAREFLENLHAAAKLLEEPLKFFRASLGKAAEALKAEKASADTEEGKLNVRVAELVRVDPVLGNGRVPQKVALLLAAAEEGCKSAKQLKEDADNSKQLEANELITAKAALVNLSGQRSDLSAVKASLEELVKYTYTKEGLNDALQEAIENAGKAIKSAQKAEGALSAAIIARMKGAADVQQLASEQRQKKIEALIARAADVNGATIPAPPAPPAAAAAAAPAPVVPAAPALEPLRAALAEIQDQGRVCQRELATAQPAIALLSKEVEGCNQKPGEPLNEVLAKGVGEVHARLTHMLAPEQAKLLELSKAFRQASHEVDRLQSEQAEGEAQERAVREKAEREAKGREGKGKQKKKEEERPQEQFGKAAEGRITEVDKKAKKDAEAEITRIGQNIDKQIEKNVPYELSYVDRALAKLILLEEQFEPAIARAQKIGVNVANSEKTLEELKKRIADLEVQKAELIFQRAKTTKAYGELVAVLENVARKSSTGVVEKALTVQLARAIEEFVPGSVTEPMLKGTDGNVLLTQSAVHPTSDMESGKMAQGRAEGHANSSSYKSAIVDYGIAIVIYARNLNTELMEKNPGLFPYTIANIKYCYAEIVRCRAKLCEQIGNIPARDQCYKLAKPLFLAAQESYQTAKEKLEAKAESSSAASPVPDEKLKGPESAFTPKILIKNCAAKIEACSRMPQLCDKEVAQVGAASSSSSSSFVTVDTPTPTEDFAAYIAHEVNQDCQVAVKLLEEAQARDSMNASIAKTFWDILSGMDKLGISQQKQLITSSIKQLTAEQEDLKRRSSSGDNGADVISRRIVVNTELVRLPKQLRMVEAAFALPTNKRLRKAWIDLLKPDATHDDSWIGLVAMNVALIGDERMLKDMNIGVVEESEKLDLFDYLIGLSSKELTEITKALEGSGFARGTAGKFLSDVKTAQRAKVQRKIKSIVEEICSSEKTFEGSLDDFCDSYELVRELFLEQNPGGAKLLATFDYMDKLLRNISAAAKNLQFVDKVLVDETAVLDKLNSLEFLLFIDALKPYINIYASLNRFSETFPGANAPEFMEIWRNHLRMKPGAFNTYLRNTLIIPVQRAPKLPLFVTDLINSLQVGSLDEYRDAKQRFEDVGKGAIAQLSDVNKAQGEYLLRMWERIVENHDLAQILFDQNIYLPLPLEVEVMDGVGKQQLQSIFALGEENQTTVPERLKLLAEISSSYFSMSDEDILIKRLRNVFLLLKIEDTVVREYISKAIVKHKLQFKGDAEGKIVGFNERVQTIRNSVKVSGKKGTKHFKLSDLLETSEEGVIEGEMVPKNEKEPKDGGSISLNAKMKQDLLELMADATGKKPLSVPSVAAASSSTTSSPPINMGSAPELGQSSSGSSGVAGGSGGSSSMDSQDDLRLPSRTQDRGLESELKRLYESGTDGRVKCFVRARQELELVFGGLGASSRPGKPKKPIEDIMAALCNSGATTQEISVFIDEWPKEAEKETLCAARIQVAQEARTIRGTLSVRSQYSRRSTASTSTMVAAPVVPTSLEIDWMLNTAQTMTEFANDATKSEMARALLVETIILFIYLAWKCDANLSDSTVWQTQVLDPLNTQAGKKLLKALCADKRLLEEALGYVNVTACCSAGEVMLRALLQADDPKDATSIVNVATATIAWFGKEGFLNMIVNRLDDAQQEELKELCLLKEFEIRFHQEGNESFYFESEGRVDGLDLAAGVSAGAVRSLTPLDTASGMVSQPPPAPPPQSDSVRSDFTDETGSAPPPLLLEENDDLPSTPAPAPSPPLSPR